MLFTFYAFCAFYAFCTFLCVNFFRKKMKELKIAPMTSLKPSRQFSSSVIFLTRKFYTHKTHTSEQK